MSAPIQNGYHQHGDHNSNAGYQMLLNDEDDSDYEDDRDADTSLNVITSQRSTVNGDSSSPTTSVSTTSALATVTSSTTAPDGVRVITTVATSETRIVELDDDGHGDKVDDDDEYHNRSGTSLTSASTTAVEIVGPLPDDVYARFSSNPRGIVADAELPPRPLDADLSNDDVAAVLDAMKDFTLNYVPHWANSSAGELDERILTTRILEKNKNSK
jgi:hypothetical protein